MRERLARRDLAVEGEEFRPHGVVELGIGHHHVEDRLRVRLDALPDADGLEQPARRRRDRRGPRILRPAVEAGIGQCDGERLAQRLPQRDREREPGEAAAGDQHVGAHRRILVLTCHAGLIIHTPLPRRPTGELVMSSAVQDLLHVLDLETLEVNLFRGRSPQVGWQRVFGGQVIGQALVAACRTVEGRLAHSMHAYFILPGDPKVPIIYEVERTRDGKSFTTRM